MFGITSSGRTTRSALAGGLALLMVLGAPALASADRDDPRGKGSVSSATPYDDGPGAKERGPAAKAPSTWVPPLGVLFNSPYAAGGRTIADRVTRTIRNTPRGELIRIAMWNFEDGPTTDALLAAHRRGVRVQLITARSTANPNFTRLQRGLRVGRTNSFAMRCAGACRSNGTTLHAKTITISRIRNARYTTMIGSINLTGAAATNQWNDMVTLRGKPLYDHMNRTFAEYRADRPVRQPFSIRRFGKTSVTLYPATGRQPILAQLRQVKCRGAAQGYGNSSGRTVVRIAVAAWFDEYGATIARHVRQLWEQGCDIRIVVTLAGRGINSALKAGGGRGPVPIRNLTVDTDGDGVPNKYLHMKAVSINGVFGNDRSASVVLTGTPNWTEDSRRADEVGLRLVEARSMTLAYQRQIDTFYNSKFANGRTIAPRTGAGLPGDEKIDWSDPNSGFELN